MQVHLQEVLNEPFEWEERRTIPLSTLDRPELIALGEVLWKGRVEHIAPDYLLRASLSYEQTLSCTRCLETISEPVQAEVTLLVQTRREDAAAGEVELQEEDLDVLVVQQETIDLEPILLEQLQLNVPMRALCRPDCAGLCPVCGTNRNLRDCDCEPSSPDPRWAALAALRKGGGDQRNEE